MHLFVVVYCSKIISIWFVDITCIFCFPFQDMYFVFLCRHLCFASGNSRPFHVVRNQNRSMFPITRVQLSAMSCFGSLLHSRTLATPICLPLERSWTNWQWVSSSEALFCSLRCSVEIREKSAPMACERTRLKSRCLLSVLIFSYLKFEFLVFVRSVVYAFTK